MLTEKQGQAVLEGLELRKTQILNMIGLLKSHKQAPAAPSKPRRIRTFSAATRQKMSDTQRRRWAMIRAAVNKKEEEVAS